MSPPTRTLLPVLWATLKLAALAAGAAVLLGFPMAWLAVRYRGPLTTILERSTYLSSSVPGVVVGLSLVTAAIHYTRPLYRTAILAIAAYVMLFLPRAMVNLRSAIGQAPPALDHAPRALGQSAFVTFWRVTVALAAPYAVCLIALSVPAAYLLLRQSVRRPTP